MQDFVRAFAQKMQMQMQRNTLARPITPSASASFSLSLSLASIAHATRAQAPIVLETGTFSAGTTHHRRHQARQRARPRNPAAQALASAPLPRAQRPGHRRFAWLGVSNDDDDAHGGDSRQANPA